MPPFAHEPATGETTLMLLETWLTTHTSSSVRGFTETGPSPTGIWASRLGLAGVVTSNTEREAFGVFTASCGRPTGSAKANVCLSLQTGGHWEHSEWAWSYASDRIEELCRRCPTSDSYTGRARRR